MDITNCPECGESTVRAGLAFWPEIDEPVTVVECVEVECSWAGVDEESVVVTHSRLAEAAA